MLLRTSKRLITFSERAIIDALMRTSLPTNSRTKRYKELRFVSELCSKDPRKAFIFLCNLIYIELLEYGIRSLKAAGRSAKRSQRRKTYDNPFVASGLGGLGELFAGPLAPLSEMSQIGGPNGLVPRPVPRILLETLPKKPEGTPE